MEVDKELAKKAITAIESLLKTADKEEQQHFVEALTLLAQCYGKDAKYQGVLLLSGDEELGTLSINADLWETAGLIQMCYDRMNIQAFNKMPDQYLAHWRKP